MDLLKKMQYWFVLEICPREFADVGISCLNNGLLSFIYLKNIFVSCLSNVFGDTSECLWDVLLRCLNNNFARHWLDLQRGYILDILKTSPTRQLRQKQAFPAKVSKLRQNILARQLLDILHMSSGPLAIHMTQVLNLNGSGIFSHILVKLTHRIVTFTLETSLQYYNK